MNQRQLRGQHFLVSGGVAERIADAARIMRGDTVLEAGTGRGILTPLLCGRARRVISIEYDGALHQEARRALSGHDNLELLRADAFAGAYEFDVFVSNLPYSHSRRAVEWLACTDFRRGAIMVQKEFAEKIAASGPGRRAISVVWQGAFRTVGSFAVGRRNFAPMPQVESVVLQFEKTRTMSRQTVSRIHALHSTKRRLVAGEGRRLHQMSIPEIIGHVL